MDFQSVLIIVLLILWAIATVVFLFFGNERDLIERESTEQGQMNDYNVNEYRRFKLYVSFSFFLSMIFIGYRLFDTF